MPDGSYETLQYTGNYDGTEGIAFRVLENDYGDGLVEGVLVGDPRGQKSFALRFNVLAQTQGGTIDTGLFSGLQSKADYLWDFFCRHQAAGNKPFFIVSHRTDEPVLVAFAEHELTYTVFAAKLFSTGLTLKERRLRSGYVAQEVPNPDMI